MARSLEEIRNDLAGLLVEIEDREIREKAEGYISLPYYLHQAREFGYRAASALKMAAEQERADRGTDAAGLALSGGLGKVLEH